MIRVKDLSNEKQKPLFSEASSVDALLAEEFDAQTLFNLLSAGTNHFTNATQTVLNQTISPDF